MNLILVFLQSCSLTFEYTLYNGINSVSSDETEEFTQNSLGKCINDKIIIGLKEFDFLTALLMHLASVPIRVCQLFLKSWNCTAPFLIWIVLRSIVG